MLCLLVHRVTRRLNFMYLNVFEMYCRYRLPNPGSTLVIIKMKFCRKIFCKQQTNPHKHNTQARIVLVSVCLCHMFRQFIRQASSGEYKFIEGMNGIEKAPSSQSTILIDWDGLFYSTLFHYILCLMIVEGAIETCSRETLLKPKYTVRMCIVASSVILSSKCRLFHNATLFGSCIINILNTGCAKI
jgi:hypothetical protein